jgi:urease accessory protein
MYDAGFPSDEVSGLQRASGELRVRLEQRNGATVLDRLFQAGCLKARFPRGAVRGWSDIVTLNTSGGIAGGDKLTSAFDIETGACATIASQAAERYYRVPVGGGPARVDTRISVGEEAAAEWLPQETILFDGCSIERNLDVTLADTSWFVGIEALIFGRAAMGERVRTGRIRDVIRVRRAGRLVWHDAVRLEGEIDALLRRPAVANAARAVASLIHVAPTAERQVDTVRTALEGLPVESGVSAWDGMLVARLLAAEAAPLRQAVTAALGALRGGRKLPRVWLC